MPIEIFIPSVPEIEFFDEKKEEFITLPEIKGAKIQLEHSLISLQNWEKKWHKPFLGNGVTKEEKTEEEILDYIRCMTLTPNVDPKLYKHIPESEVKKIKEYIDDPMTATWFSNKNGGPDGSGKKQVVTAEIIYYWMISLQIPPEYRKWHLNQLLTLIRVISIENSPKKKMSKNDILRQNARLNKARRAKHNSRG